MITDFGGIYIVADDTIMHRPRLFGLCPLRGWIKLYYWIAYNSVSYVPIYLIFIPNCRGKRGVFTYYEFGGFGLLILSYYGLYGLLLSDLIWLPIKYLTSSPARATSSTKWTKVGV